jgi:NhaP-type Na+/H+ or K+/H+ antiporter
VLIVLVFGLTLLVAVLISELSARSVVSTAVLFLVTGFVLGDGVLGLLSLDAGDPKVAVLTELALFSVLFTEGMRIGVKDLVSAWRLPGRALLLGLPLTLAATALLAHAVAGLPWAEALLLGAVLSPTDPVFAAALVGRPEVPRRIRHLLNVESGVNDGLALPVVLAMLTVVSDDRVTFAATLGKAAFGIAIGVGVPWIALRLEGSRFFQAGRFYKPLNAFAIGVIVLGLASLTHANEFLAAFAAGVTVMTVSPEFREAFQEFGELLTELLKLGTLLVVGALVSPRFLAEISSSGYLFALLVLVAVRPFALGIALTRSGLTWREWAAVSWFGPRGFASMFYALLILRAGIARGDEIFHLTVVVVAASIFAHSSTDVLVARWFARSERRAAA